MHKVMIMRGLPGSGKSHAAKFIKSLNPDHTIICSADDYWLDEEGNYNFNPKLLPVAHASCLKSFLEELQKDTKTIIVDNTNIKCHEYTPYAALAIVFGYEVEVLKVNTSFETCAGRQTHGVPLVTLRRMEQTFEKTIPYHKERVIEGE